MSVGKLPVFTPLRAGSVNSEGLPELILLAARAAQVQLAQGFIEPWFADTPLDASLRSYRYVEEHARRRGLRRLSAGAMNPTDPPRNEDNRCEGNL